MPPRIIFRGQGNITEEERIALDGCENIRWSFQPKAWADGKYSRKWLKSFIHETDKIGGDHLLLLDDLGVQQDEKFRDLAVANGILPLKIPGGCTDLLQPGVCAGW